MLNAQLDEAESNSTVGFKKQKGGQIGWLGVYAYVERSIGMYWTYRADVECSFQGYSLQYGYNGSGRLIPATSVEIRRYWSTQKEEHSNFVSLKAKRQTRRSIVLSGSSSESVLDLTQTSMSLFVGRNVKIKAHGRAELGCGLDLLHLEGDFFKIRPAPMVHLRFGIGW